MDEEYRRTLAAKGIVWQRNSDGLHFFCPQCKAGDVMDRKTYTAVFNVPANQVRCLNCGAECSWKEWERHFSALKLPPRPVFNVLSVDEIKNQDFGKEEWLVDRLIPRNGIVALSGDPSSYKTWITMDIALAVADGAAALGHFKCMQGPVLIIDEENNLQIIQKRYQLLSARKNVPIFYISRENFRADKKGCVAAIRDIIRERRIALVIADSLVRIHNQQENDAGQMAIVFNGLQEFTKASAAVLFTHHNRKPGLYFGSNNPAQNMRGSSDILAAVDGHISVEKKSDEEILILRQNKARASEQLEPFEVAILKDAEGMHGFGYKGQHDEKKTKAERAKEAIVAFLQEGTKSRQEIEETLSREFGKGAISDGIRLTIKEGLIEKIPKGELPKEQATHSRKHFYRLTIEEAPDSI